MKKLNWYFSTIFICLFFLSMSQLFAQKTQSYQPKGITENLNSSTIEYDCCLDKNRKSDCNCANVASRISVALGETGQCAEQDIACLTKMFGKGLRLIDPTLSIQSINKIIKKNTILKKEFIKLHSIKNTSIKNATKINRPSRAMKSRLSKTPMR